MRNKQLVGLAVMFGAMCGCTQDGSSESAIEPNGLGVTRIEIYVCI